MNGKSVNMLLVLIAFLLTTISGLLGMIWKDSTARMAAIETSVIAGDKDIQKNTVEIALDKRRIVKLEIAVRVLDPAAQVGQE